MSQFRGDLEVLGDHPALLRGVEIDEPTHQTGWQSRPIEDVWFSPGEEQAPPFRVRLRSGGDPLDNFESEAMWASDDNGETYYLRYDAPFAPGSLRE